MNVPSATPVPARHYLLLFLAAFAFHLTGTWSLPLIDRDEPRFAEASREMLERQDYVVPYFNDEYRFDKPPLTYWLQSTAYRFLGDNELAARLPSVLSAAGIALLLLAWGTRLRDASLGWQAAIIFTLSLQVVLHAKAAVADMPLVFFVCLSAWAGWEMLRDSAKNSPASRWWWIYFLALALGFLAKGPIAWLPLIPVIIGLIKPPPLRARLAFPIGILLTLGLVALWGIPALEKTNGEFFKIGIGKHVVGRSVSTMEGHGVAGVAGYVATMPLYFVTIFLSLAPWSWFLPKLVRQFRHLWLETNTRYLLLSVLLWFVVFSLVKTKLPHYTLPAFPMLALLLAGLISTTQIRKIATWSLAFYLLLFFIAFPISARWFPSPSLAEITKPYLTPDMEFAATDYVEGSLVWSFRKHIHGYMSKVSPKKAKRWMQKSGPRFYILPTADLPKAFPEIPSEWKTFRHRGFNIAKFELTDLTLIMKK